MSPEYTACAWIFIILRESSLHQLWLPDPLSMPGDFLTLLQGAAHGALASGSLCTTTTTTSMLGDKLLAMFTGEEILSWLLPVAILALPIGHLQEDQRFF